MNTQINTKTRRQLFSPTYLTLLIGVVVLVLGSQPAHAQTATDTTTTTAVSPTAPVDSSVTIAAKGSVTDPNGTITVNGSVIITCRRVIDTTVATMPSLVLLDFDFSQLQGTSGTLKAQTVYVTGGNHATQLRPLQTTDTIIVTAPYYDSTKDGLSARSMLVTATLNFDVSTGKVTSGSISVGNNVVTSATVGTVAASPTP